MSFKRGLPQLDIVRLLHTQEDFDIFDCSDNVGGLCSFYGRKEVLSWLIQQSISQGCKYSVADRVQLALNIARNIEHNGAELVKTVLATSDLQAALSIKDEDGVTLLHRLASRIGGSRASGYLEKQWNIRVWDEGFHIPGEPSHGLLLVRERWRALLCSCNLNGVDLSPISTLETMKTTPMTMGFRILVFTCSGSSSKQLAAISEYLIDWLSDLAALGVDILSYGETEKRLQSEGLVTKDFNRQLFAKNSQRSTKEIDRSYGTLRLISFEPSKFPAKWKLWWSEPTDEFAGEFWQICEPKSARLPGSWDEDPEWP